jgi:hypothetical protein
MNENQFSPNIAINNDILELLIFFDNKSQKKMKKAIYNAKKSAIKHHDENTDAGARHIFREFIPAAELNKIGYLFEYEKEIEHKTPDWIDDKVKIIMEVFTFERGGTNDFINRITTKINLKCEKYDEIIKRYSYHFLISIYLDFLTGITIEECKEYINKFRTIMNINNSLWGILFFYRNKCNKP